MFCEDHFESKFLRRQFNRTTLHRSAVPYPYSKSQQIGLFQIFPIFPWKIYKRISFPECIEMAESEDEVEPVSIKLEMNNEQQDDANSFIILLDHGEPKKVRRIEAKKDTQLNLNTKRIINSGKREHESNQETDDINVLIVSNNETSNDLAELPKQPETNATEIQTKRSRIEKSPIPLVVDEKSSQNIESPTSKNVQKTIGDVLVSSSEKVDSNSEETYFALSLVGILKRLPPHKRAIAKCHILNYLTELEYGSSSELSN